MSTMCRVLAAACIVACGQKPPANSAAPTDTNIADREWVLVALGDRTAPFGPQVRPPTLKLAPVDFRATGFAGCNRYFATYSISGASLMFESPGATTMFCAASDSLERAFLGMLPEVTTYQVDDTVLTLTTKNGLVARFHAAR
ncbi:MAG TPA: META domain-containing protein [Gemmatimonadaceae bacterium]